ncbi:hypothetical protein [Mucilaginibacter lappiensis]|uniref:Lipocalin-like domain-containing protein n=1 Tax=Mucilaginibacter lappiensis TaxID=354630 RepID=A0A1N6SB34_9SPHI|nr:hypothetical protein [Mucilaginibacter lappiensis]MBB6108433.1 hypothetical protein [Mucilaginibacter lappiensis]MBB6130046.1 hypothetical protein [Mucilaginibacter lappiensis]SIQ38166.1 hypothetical protein SAMN05421821_102330 [Mucilaginibacter lappiensis]
MKTPIFFILLSATLSFTACTKDKATAPPQKLDGTYTGAFTSSSTDATNATAKVVISGKTYQATLNTAFGVSSKGSYATGNNQIAFTDSTVHTANFDWGLLLNGTYTSTTKGDSLILVKKGAGFNYTYRLKKQ